MASMASKKVKVKGRQLDLFLDLRLQQPRAKSFGFKFYKAEWCKLKYKRKESIWDDYYNKEHCSW